MVFQKIVVPLCRVKEITQRPGPVPGKEQNNVSNAINGHLQKNASDQNVQKNVWPEILYKGRNDCQLRNSQKFNPVFPFGNRTPDCTTFKVIKHSPGQPGPQIQNIMAYTINTKYEMKAKVQTIIGGKVRNHRGFVDAAKWIDERINFLLTIYKFDDYKVAVTGNVYRLVAWRKAGKPGTNGKAMDVTHVVTVVE